MAASSSLKAPALVHCKTLRARLLGLDLARALPAQLVAKRSKTGLFCYSADDVNKNKRTVGAARFAVEWETLGGGELLEKCAAQSSEAHAFAGFAKHWGPPAPRGVPFMSDAPHAALVTASTSATALIITARTLPLLLLTAKLTKLC